MMKKCGKHGCMLIIKKMPVGWGNESLKVCPECEKERDKSKKPESVFAASKPGWQ